MQREAVESIEAQRVQMISALFANPNWDGEENGPKRQEQIQALNRSFNDAIEVVYHGKKKEPEIDWDNPFYAAAKRGLERTRRRLGLDPASEIGDHVEPLELDQARIKARLEARQTIDQAE